MIVFPDRDLVLVTPPHTASGALHSLLCCREHGGRWVVGPNADGVVDHHLATLAAGFSTYRVAVVTRHPLDRLVGLWHHWAWSASVNGYGCCDFAQFVDLVVDRGADWFPHRVPWFYCWTITDLVGDLLDARPDAVFVRWEHLAGDLASRLGLDAPSVPDVHRSNRRPWPDYFGDRPQAYERAVGWGGADATRFGYSLEKGRP